MFFLNCLYAALSICQEGTDKAKPERTPGFWWLVCWYGVKNLKAWSRANEKRLLLRMCRKTAYAFLSCCRKDLRCLQGYMKFKIRWIKCGVKEKRKCEDINQPRIRLKKWKRERFWATASWLCVLQIDRGESTALSLLRMCIYHTQKSKGGISCKPPAPCSGGRLEWGNGVTCVLVELEVGTSCPLDSPADLRGHKRGLRLSRRRKRKRPITQSRKRLERLGVWGEIELSKYSQTSSYRNSSDRVIV